MAKWINTNNWLKGYVSENNKPDLNSGIINKAKEARAAVVRLRLKCPMCRSLKIKCYGADKPVLYYKCNECGFKFKVLEVDKL